MDRHECAEDLFHGVPIRVIQKPDTEGLKGFARASRLVSIPLRSMALDEPSLFR